MYLDDIASIYSRINWLPKRRGVKRLIKFAESIRPPSRSLKKISLNLGHQSVQVRLDINKWLQRNVFYHGSFEPEVQQFIINNCKSGGVFVDVGANIGLYSVIAAKLVGNKGAVYSFEPTKGFYSKLVNNVELNKLTNVFLNKLIVSNDNSPQRIGVTDQTASINLKQSSVNEYEEVDAITLDAYFSKQKVKIDLLKIDVDGWDYNVLLGAEKIFEEQKPLVVIECLNYGPISPELIYDFMYKRNYKIFYEKNLDLELTKKQFQALMRERDSIDIMGIPRSL